TTPTSSGPAVAIVVSPKQLSIHAGWYGELIDTARDQHGAFVTRVATWRSSNPAVVIVKDTGVVYGNAPGTAFVYASLDGHTDSATVTVTAAHARTTPTDTAHADSATTTFDLTYIVNGAASVSDTTTTTPVAGAVVALSRVIGVNGDTLSSSDTATQAITDASGAATFTGLKGGAYHVVITPPAGSPYRAATGGFGPPISSDVTIHATLTRTP
ncbi:MAG TPA: hypothetical protein VHV78_18130, partial [Gemmatimonadaceae bacterium]|nr:hypothetical protein [Gemmatimonadaceae bacterium]